MSYLILHKVRGEPAFDIADKLQIGDEEGWIIPTSGHRAYPYLSWDLYDFPEVINAKLLASDLPPSLPDHYEIDKGGPPPSGVNIMNLISNLLPKIKRRV